MPVTNPMPATANPVSGASTCTADAQATSALPAGTPIAAGLDGVVAAETRLSRVDGAAGHLLLAGYAVEDLAGRVPWEAVLYLLWWDRLPDEGELAQLRAELASHRALPAVTRAALRAAATAGRTPIDALMLACTSMSPDSVADVVPSVGSGKELAEDWSSAVRLAAGLPVALAAFLRMRDGLDPLPARDDLGLAGNLLWQLGGIVPSEAEQWALDTYLVTTADHGLNASTFTARVIAATGAAPHAALAGAIGALSGWRHGGAPGPVLEMFDEIGRPERARAWLDRRLAEGGRIMGFGHRVYRVRDPRAAVLSEAVTRLRAEQPATRDEAARVTMAETVEREALAALEAAKPGRALHTNVEFYTAMLLDALAIDAELFTPFFAVARSAGWLAHAREAAADRLVRPRARYVGAVGRRL